MTTNIKPAAILDDDASFAIWIARSVRGFGGLPTVYYPSVENFYRSVGLPQDPDTPSLAQVLTGYSAVICDNNFSGAYPDGKIEGLNFLLEKVGPASKLVASSERPYLISFAPSSAQVIRNTEAALWDQFAIASFNKLHEYPAIGLSVRLSREFGIPLSRQAVVEGVFGQNREDDPIISPSREFFQTVFFEFLLNRFPHEGARQVEGPAEEVGWDELISGVAKIMKLEEGKLLERIQREVSISRQNTEGQIRARKEFD